MCDFVTTRLQDAEIKQLVAEKERLTREIQELEAQNAALQKTRMDQRSSLSSQLDELSLLFGEQMTALAGMFSELELDTSSDDQHSDDDDDDSQDGDDADGDNSGNQM